MGRGPGPRVRERPAPRALSRVFFAVTASAAACGGAPPPSVPPNPLSALAPTPEGSLARIELRRFEARPRLTLVSRDGDPFPAVAVSVATDLGSIGSTALAAALEQRLEARGFDVESRADRDALHLTWSPRVEADVEAFIAALRESFEQPVVDGGADLALARERLASLARNPLEAPALDAIAGCTGQLGVADASRVPSLAGGAGAAQLEAWRRSALVTGRASLAAVGPAGFCQEVADELASEDAWPVGPEASARSAGEAFVGTATSDRLESGAAEVTVAVRVSDARRAVAAGERLGRAASPLSSKLPALLSPTWRVDEVVGVARASGGCVSVTVKTHDAGDGEEPAQRAADAALLLEREIAAETAALHEPTIASRQILGATDPREAATLAAWWALSTSSDTGHAAPGQRPFAVVLTLPPDVTPPTEATPAAGSERFARALAAARRDAATSALEHRAKVERGQSSMWLLLASPCGAAAEGDHDAGTTAIAALAAVQSAVPPRGVTLEPWITPDGVGVIARGTLEGNDTPEALARRVADTAAEVMVASPFTDAGLTKARAHALSHLERYAGPVGEALEAFAGRAQPTHPSWIVPFGFRRAAASPRDALEDRWRELTSTPLRLAVIANADMAQATAAIAAAERWVPRARSACSVGPAPAADVGRLDKSLPSHGVRAQAIVGARVPAVGRAEHELAKLTAWVLQGPSGRLQRAIAAVPGARAEVRVLGGRRAAALAIDVRAPAGRVELATKAVHGALDALLRDGVPADERDRAWSAYVAHRDAELADPRERLARLWHGEGPGSALTQAPSEAAWTSFLRESLAAGRRIEVLAEPR